ncbi:MAG: DUF1566 domain-containing protein [Moritella sp.]|uniref:Lcl C-terminal domain-containing protein n=1 Tax=Moritella sp. PE36 TaxID=58051 RepID=UPI0001568239|nr:DUF1566 domain-containing protein [Moritella sp. PE36]EDM67484.1 putative Fimh-like protein [Moritella sp. PE36]PHR88087.1 MAG: DUF1566 domain-containing protein [Moritella sp.]
MKKIPLLLICAGLFSSHVFAASDPVNLNCDATLQQDYTPSDFIDNHDGTVVDLRTSLVWAKCTIGQSYNRTSNTCSGSGAISFATWEEALLGAEAHSVNNISDWRLPNIKELGSLIDRSCAEPAINLTLFPNAISSIYYSSTPYKGSADLTLPYSITHLVSRVIDFSNGTEVPFSQHDSSLTTYAVRAVKGGYR